QIASSRAEANPWLSGGPVAQSAPSGVAPGSSRARGVTGSPPERPDIRRADHDVVEPDAVDRIRLRPAVLSRGVFGDVVQEPEEVDLHVPALAPAETFEGLAALRDHGESHAAPRPPRGTPGDAHHALSVQPESQLAARRFWLG